MSEKKKLQMLQNKVLQLMMMKRGILFLKKLARKRSISHYLSEVMKNFHGYEYEICYYRHLENTSKFICDKENEYFGILSSDTMETSTPLLVGLFKCQASHLCIPVYLMHLI